MFKEEGQRTVKKEKLEERPQEDIQKELESMLRFTGVEWVVDKERKNMITVEDKLKGVKL